MHKWYLQNDSKGEIYSGRSDDRAVQEETGSILPRYKMNHLKRGKAIIINNKDFSNDLKVREGTDKDASDLEKCLSKLGFEVTRFDNLTAKDMECKLREGDILYMMIFNIGRIKYTWYLSWSFVLYLIVLSKIIKSEHFSVFSISLHPLAKYNRTNDVHYAFHNQQKCSSCSTK